MMMIDKDNNGSVDQGFVMLAIEGGRVNDAVAVILQRGSMAPL